VDDWANHDKCAAGIKFFSPADGQIDESTNRKNVGTFHEATKGAESAAPAPFLPNRKSFSHVPRVSADSDADIALVFYLSVTGG
jgi:hypothetical protein